MQYTLSEMVKWRNSLRVLKLDSQTRNFYHDICHLVEAVKNNPLVDSVEKLQTPLSVIDDNIHALGQEYSSLLKVIDDLIQYHEKRYFELSESIFQEQKFNSTEYILDRETNFSDIAKEEFKNMLKSMSDWKFPGMFIRPGRKDIIEEITSSDPFYIVDTGIDLLTPAKQRFNDVYINRCRWNVIESIDVEKNCLSFVPDQQLGLTLIMDFFEYITLERILKLTHDVFEKTRSGGKLVFTYNNCDLESSVNMVEKNFRTYTPGTLLQKKLKEQGWLVLKQVDVESSYSWLELAKPGQLTSLRGGQSLGAVRNTPGSELSKAERDARNKSNGIKV